MSSSGDNSPNSRWECEFEAKVTPAEYISVISSQERNIRSIGRPPILSMAIPKLSKQSCFSSAGADFR